MGTYGFLGLGIMGRAMAGNLLRAGHTVVVWNRTTARCDPLLELGAARASTPSEVTRSCPVTFAMVSDPTAAWELCFGEGGALEGLGDGRGYVDSSTVDPDTAAGIGSAVHEIGGRFLEAPVSGSRGPAEEGTLVFLAAGDEGLYAEVTPALEAMGSRSVFLGEAGNGARMKLVINMVMGTMLAGLGEGLALAERVGLRPDDLFDVLAAGAMANALFAAKGPAMAAGDYTVSFPLRHAQKDLRLALSVGDLHAQALPVAAAANELYKRARDLGAGDEDICAVDRAIRCRRDG